MNVLVVGGSGFVGTELCAELVERGHAVTVLSRSPELDVEGDVRTVSGDVTDYDSVEPAFEGQDAVVNLVALSPLFKPDGGDEMHDRVHRGGTENVVAAAEAHGVERVVQMSALGADADGPTAYIRAKGDAERAVRESSLEWVIVRPSVVFGEGGEFVSFTKMLTTPYVTGLPGGGETRFQPIWVGDLAPMLADCVERDEHAGQTYELGGPEVLTLADVAKLVYRAEGKSLRVLPIPMSMARLGLTVGGAVPKFPMGADQYRSLQFDNTVTENDVRAFGVDPTDLRTLSEYLGIGDEVSESGPSRSVESAA
ncbi:NADH dehydrogenase [Halopelagius inordinatus]|uniref:NADH dehydrogenase n=1 Tax=Halopelagius inordinatus TaxID=553467 RepID=A0A1I2VRC7_9EURY|nr:complex I NDUFA9 subunit family protein [Halopelagius inordinatus]SFG91583.1 NADH dehydrogenase [Halopelagius inordinatus]